MTLLLKGGEQFFSSPSVFIIMIYISLDCTNVVLYLDNKLMVTVGFSKEINKI